MDDYLSKPFTQDQLVLVLERWLARKAGTETSPSRFTTPVSNMADANTESHDAAASSPAIDRQVLVAIQALQRPGKPNVLNKAITIYPMRMAIVELFDLLNALHESGKFLKLRRLITGCARRNIDLNGFLDGRHSIPPCFARPYRSRTICINWKTVA